jgi:hypothetical protein
MTLRSSGPHRGQVPSPFSLSRCITPARSPLGPLGVIWGWRQVVSDLQVSCSRFTGL